MSVPMVDTTSAQGSSVAVAAVCLLVLVALSDAGIVAAVAPQIAADLNVSKTSVAASAGIYAIVAASVALVLGKFGARVQSGLWLPLAAVIFAISALLAASAGHISVFYAARALAGFAGGLISALAIAALADASAYAERGKQMSGVAVSYFLAPVVGIPVGVLLTDRFGWEATFASIAVAVASAGVLVWKNPLIDHAQPALANSADVARQPSYEAGYEADHTAGGASSSLPSSLWRVATSSRSAVWGITGAFFVSGGLVGFTSYLGTWLSDAFQLKANAVGLVYLAAGCGAVLGGVLGGILADKFGKRQIALQGSLWLIVLLLIVPTFAWGWMLIATLSVAAFVAGLRIAPLQALITELVPATNRATYVALRNSASQLGIAATVWLGGSVYMRYGLVGVAAECALLTAGAWFTTRCINEPISEQTNELPAYVAEVETTEALAATTTRTAAVASVRSKQRRRRSVAQRAVKIAAVATLMLSLGMPWLISFAITKAGTRPDERMRTDTPATHGVSFEDVVFASSDGNQLSGWYLPAQLLSTPRLPASQIPTSSQSSQLPPGKSTTIIMTHGLFRSRYEMLERGLAFYREGYSVLLYDLRRHGRSPAEFSTVGYHERKDVLAAIDFARKRASNNGIVLMGVSMGAAATLLAAAEESNDVSAIVAESSFLSFKETTNHHLRLAHLPPVPFATLLVNFTAWRMNFTAGDFDVLGAVRKINVPILFIGGSEDVRMPVASVLEPLYQAAQHPLKEKLIIPGARHGHAYATRPEEYRTAVSSFIRRAASK